MIDVLTLQKVGDALCLLQTDVGERGVRRRFISFGAAMTDKYEIHAG